ncbi:MAG TPA: TIGR03013 family XrtA/PEP-CTERM system glycosyltransferase [Bryobacteraceae bacterium]|jgi:sugar transferase (PEP-CTERM system associated)
MIRLFRVFIPVGTLALLISEILLVAGSFVLAAYYVMPVDPASYLLDDGGAVSILLVLLSILVGMYLHDLYSEIYVKSRIVLIQELCLVIGIAFLMQGLISYLDSALRMPIRVMVVGSFLAMAAIFFWRLLFSAYVAEVVGRDHVLLVGSSPVLTSIATYISSHPETGLTVTGYVDDPAEPGADLPGAKLLGPLASLQDIVSATRPTRIIVGMFERRNRMPMSELLELRFAGHVIEEAATAYESVCGRVCVQELRPSQLIYSGELGPRRQTMLYQSLSNILLAGVGLVVATPLMLLTALAVRLSSAGPVLYRQVRVGMDSHPFTLYKFRSMRADAEAQTGAVWAAKDDPRVTAVGRIIRKIRFDELPQLFNVLKGEMSIVGPRPERPEFVEELSAKIPYYRQRHCVRPGITGWAQINYKYGDTLEDTITKLEYDLFYIKNMSLTLDTYIIFHTVKAMLLSRGSQ